MDLAKDLEKLTWEFNKNFNKSKKDFQKNLVNDTKRFQYNLFENIENKRLNTNQTMKLKELIGKKCELCGKKVQKHWYLNHHHITPFTKNKKNTMGNVIILCLFCHADVTYDPKKKGRTFATQLRKKVKQRNKKISNNSSKLKKLKSIYSKKKPVSSNSILDQFLFGYK